jgi:hypothetical protein
MKNIVTKKSVLNLLNSTFPNTRIHIENLSKTNLEFSLKTLGSSDISEPKIIKHDNFDLLYIGKLKIDGKCVYTYQIHNIVNDELIHDVLSIIYRNQLEANLGGIVGWG